MTQAALENINLRNTHDFFLQILRNKLGHDVPLPQGAASSETLVRWVNLLDLAITAPMMRDALRENPSPTTTASLLRYYISKQIRGDTERDKTDFI
ncbi:MAG: hypothetical protein ACM3JB_05155, partial [Acidobacteriaceae bacterium]